MAAERCSACRNDVPGEIAKPVYATFSWARRCIDSQACDARVDAKLAEHFPHLSPGRMIQGQAVETKLVATEARLRGAA
jgi:hypothetical protein